MPTGFTESGPWTVLAAALGASKEDTNKTHKIFETNQAIVFKLYSTSPSASGRPDFTWTPGHIVCPVKTKPEHYIVHDDKNKRILLSPLGSSKIMARLPKDAPKVRTHCHWICTTPIALIHLAYAFVALISFLSISSVTCYIAPITSTCCDNHTSVRCICINHVRVPLVPLLVPLHVNV